jgi:hypothetical protein
MSMIDPKGSGDTSKAMDLIRLHRSQNLVATAVILRIQRGRNVEPYDIDERMERALKMAKK